MEEVLVKARVIEEVPPSKMLIHINGTDLNYRIWVDKEDTIRQHDEPAHEVITDDTEHVITCGVCKMKFAPVRSGTCVDVAPIIGKGYWDYMNCPYCGCQVLLKKRLLDIQPNALIEGIEGGF